MRIIQVGLSQSYFQFQLADSIYSINSNYKELGHLSLNHTEINQVSFIHKSLFPQLVYQSKTLIGDSQFQIQVNSKDNQEFQLVMDQHIVYVSKKIISTDSSELCVTLLFGPALILNLALNHVFCFHASSFEYKGSIFIVFAKSGTGKSTIAEFFQQTYNSRIADDIVAMKNIDGVLNLLPNFPQLKLSTENQSKQTHFNKNIKLVFAHNSAKPTRLNKIDRFSAIKSTIKHSVATKIFSSPILANHLDFCHQLVQQTDAFELEYQHSKSSLNQLCNLLDDLV
jgi:hypothetical protein